MKYGPYLPHPEDPKRKIRTYLVAFIDDATRLLCHGEFYTEQKLPVLEDCFRKAVLKRGLPDNVYIDNGKIFVSRWFRLACARLNIRHITAAAYSPESKGKIERWNRTVEDFLAEISLEKPDTLAALNQAFATWREEGYNHRVHSALPNVTPAQRFQDDEKRLRFVTLEECRDAFLWEESRRVDKAGCIKLQGNQYEVGLELIRKTVDVRYDPFNLEIMEIWLNGEKKGLAKPLVIHEFNIVISDIGISYETIDCSKSRFQFNSKSAILEETNYSYLWDFGDGDISNARNPIHNYKKNGEFNVQLIISNGISSSSFQTVVYVNLVTRLRLDKEPKFCAGDSVMVYAKGAVSYKWSNGSIDDHITIKTADDYSVIGTTIEGCKDTLYFSSGSYDVYTYSIITENNEKVPEDSEVQFWSESIPYSAYHWDFGDGTIEDGNRVSHKFKTNQLGFYDIKLNVVNPNGCTEYATKRIWIKTPIDLPNTFTPNGDGINDRLLQGWQIKLFNRNGILLYEGNEGWNGNYKGQAVSSGVYYYQIFYPSGTGIKTESGYVRVVR